MQALTTLLDDHHYIGGMLDVLEAVAWHLEEGRELDRNMVSGVRQYFEQFVPTHERKEEERLFPQIERHLTPDDRHLLAALVAEHRVLGALRTALLPHLSPGVSADLAPLATAYIVRKREHLRLEDALLHRMLQADDEGLGEALAEVEREGLGPTGREWFTQVALDYTSIVATWTGEGRGRGRAPGGGALRRQQDSATRKKGRGRTGGGG